GRLAGDPLGTLPQGEVSLMAGSGSQTGSAGRWGDYSMMGLDEADGCTFWYTQEYIATTGGASWRTRIGSFKFPSCSPPTAVTLEGTVTDSDFMPIADAYIDVSGGYGTITDETGHYALSLEDGVYDVTASKYGYFTSTAPGVIVEPPGTRQDFTLSAAPIHTLSGVIADATGGWPLYARIDISDYPGGPVFTDPATGAYELQLAEGTYNLSINALSGGYLPAFQLLIFTGDTHQDLALSADLSACAAPGYASLPSGSVEYPADSPRADCTPIPGHGLVVGGIYDANTGEAAANPSVKDIDGKPAALIDNFADALQVHPLYIISQPVGSASLTASAPNYRPSAQTADVLEYAVTRQDFSLAAGMLSANPGSLSYAVTIPEPMASKSLNLSNTGGAPANVEVFAIPGMFQGYAPTGPFAPHTRHFGPKNLYDLDASHIRLDLTPRDVPLVSGGEVSASWPSGLAYAWGIGFNTDETDLWLGNLQSVGGDGLNHRFTIEGADTGDKIDTSAWVGLWNADMAYNPLTHKLWQVNVGGDECIYELDPATKTPSGNKICPAFGTSERGLAFDSRSGTFYSGSWNDGIINHFAPDGTLIDSADVSLNISGLAFNPSTGHLFALTSNNHSDNAYDVYVLDTQNAYRILGGFNLVDHGLEAFTPFGQAGLEIDCAGNLWAIDQYSQMVYVAGSGEAGVCDWQATWLSVEPTKATVDAGGDVILNVNVDATGLPAGVYQAYLRVVGDTPYGDTIVPVSLTNNTLLFLPVIDR
ncbi:MAG: carboxypeptidase regulatory-like domain-containing protein, partial [Acidobacteriaceae bacterium]